MKVSFEISRGKKAKKSAVPEQPVSANAKPAKKPASRRKKFIILGVYLALLVVFIISASNPARVYLDKTYTNKQYNFSIRILKGWQTKEGADNAIVSFSDPKAPADKININANQTDLSLKDYIAQVKPALPQVYTDWSLLDEYDTTVNKQNVHVIDGQAPIGGVWKHARVMVAIKNGTAYAVAATAQLSDWGTNKIMLDTALKSFKVTQ